MGDCKGKYEDISFQVSTCEGVPVMVTVFAEEQRDFVQRGYGSVSELIDLNIAAYQDWQADC